MRSARQFTRGLAAGQRLPYIIWSRVDGTGTSSLLSGSKDLTLTDNGVGDYTLTFKQAFRQVPVVTASILAASGVWRIHAVSVTAVQLKFFAVDGTTPADVDFHVIIVGSDAESEV